MIPPWLARLHDLLAPWQSYLPFLPLGVIVIGLLMLQIQRRVTHRVTPAVRTPIAQRPWSAPAALKAVGAYNDFGMYLGMDGRGRFLRAPWERSVAIFGGPGAGKTLTNVLTTITDCNAADQFIIDFSGDLVRRTADYRRFGGRGEVYVLDLGDPRSPDQLDLLSLVRWQTPHEFPDLQRQSDHIVKPRDASASRGAQHYDRVATAIIPLSMLYLHYADPTHCTYAGLLDFFSAVGRTPQSVIKEMGAMPSRTLQRGAARLLNQDQRSMREDWSAAAEWLTLWEDPILARNTSRTTIPWTAFQQDQDTPRTLYLRVDASDVKGRLRPVLRLILDQLLFLLSSRRSTDYARELLILIDDAAELGDLPILEEIAAMKRKYGLRLLVAYQSPTQIWDASGRWSTGLLNACGCWVIYPQNEPDAAKYLSRKASDMTEVQAVDRVSSKAFSLFPTRMRGAQTREVPRLSEGDLLTLDPEHLLVCIDGTCTLARRIYSPGLRPFRKRLAA